ncbi:lysine-specific demethylase 4c isoform 1 [Nannochloropsis gaditana]|uniref:Lysine-specific demethylase 4c isoform 1 n=1 Tax=Nannochloropsis gaditana TaxID=72520 RepID=W7TED2_9STRA|nr:lysine-specific demethylase 4c isoform 1 [Nannochloropsis gaditana]
MSSTTCPVFRPSREEFKNFSAYIDKIDSRVGNAGLCKIIPPEGWYDTPTEAEFEGMWAERGLVVPPIKQCVSGLRGVYQLGLMDGKKMAVKDFQALAKKTEPDQAMSYSEIERLFWRSMGPLAPPPLYGADMSGSLFRDRASGWNLSELDNMIKLLPSNLPGITTAMLYFGMWRAMFAFHTEDMNLYSINYLHAGRPKSWYSIPPHAQRRFESLAQSLNPQGFRTCSEFLRHKTSIFSPKVLRESGIPFHTLVQEPGEFVVTFPASYHAGFNHGFNIAEATNFSTERWLSKGREAKVCRCQPYSVHINMDDFAAKLAAKRAADQARVEALPNKTSKIDRKKILRRLSYIGWMAWREQEEEARRVEEALAVKERQRLQREQTNLRRKEKVRRLNGGTLSLTVGEGEGGGDGQSAEDSEERVGGDEGEDEEDGGPARQGLEVDLAAQKQWDFRCRCGVAATSGAPVQSWPKGAIFQCAGCLAWSHTRCLYSKDHAPRRAFCAGCHQVLQRLEASGADWPTGRRIKLRSKVVVCRGPRGLEEGSVTMIGEGMARVYFKGMKKPRKRDRAGAPGETWPKALKRPMEEWVNVMSSRFLSRERVQAALGQFSLQSIPTQDCAISESIKMQTPQPQKIKLEQGLYHHGDVATSAGHCCRDQVISASSLRGSGAAQPPANTKRGMAPHPAPLLRGVPLPDAQAAVRHAKFQKDLARSKKAFRSLFSPTRNAEAVPGVSYSRYHAAHNASIFDGEWSDDEEGERKVLEEQCRGLPLGNGDLAGGLNGGRGCGSAHDDLSNGGHVLPKCRGTDGATERAQEPPANSCALAQGAHVPSSSACLYPLQQHHEGAQCGALKCPHQPSSTRPSTESSIKNASLDVSGEGSSSVAASRVSTVYECRTGTGNCANIKLTSMDCGQGLRNAGVPAMGPGAVGATAGTVGASRGILGRGR